MRPLTAHSILDAWERGRTLHPIDRALILLRAGLPEVPWAELVAMSIGQRDAQLFKLRAQTLDDRLDVFTTCPQCGAELEFALETGDLLGNEHDEPLEAEQTFAIDGYGIGCRLPNSKDLAAVASCGGVEESRELLVRRSINRSTHNGLDLPLEEIPRGVIAAVGDRLAQKDRLAEVQLDLGCPECGHHWSSLLDIVAFFWEEICALAKRLLREVHVLARAYGWCEADILSMGASRRYLYVQMVS